MKKLSLKLGKFLKILSLATITLTSLSITTPSEAVDYEHGRLLRTPDDYVTSPISICSIKFKDIRYAETQLSSYTNESFKKAEDLTKLNVPGIPAVMEISKNLFYQLQEQGVDISNLFSSKTLTVTVLDGEVSNIDGYAFWNNRSYYIYMNGKFGTYWTWQRAHEVVLHEYGHIVDREYIDDEAFREYRKYRGIPSSWTDSGEWHKRPMEVFAEDFKEAFLPPVYSTYNATDHKQMTTEDREWFRDFIIDNVKKKTNSSSSEESTTSEDRKLYDDVASKGLSDGSYFLDCANTDTLSRSVTRKELADHYLQVYRTINQRISSFESASSILNRLDASGYVYDNEPATSADLSTLELVFEFPSGSGYTTGTSTTNSTSTLTLKDYYRRVLTYFNN